MSLTTHADRRTHSIDTGATPSDSETVAAVEKLIEATLGSLRASWTELAAGVVPRPGVLRTDSVLELLAGLTTSGGKRLRPRMVHWGWVAAGGRSTGGYEHVVGAGAALELLHVFALIHDDVITVQRLAAATRYTPSAPPYVRCMRWVTAALRRKHRDPCRRSGAQRASALMAGLPAYLQQHWRALSIELMVGRVASVERPMACDLAHARRWRAPSRVPTPCGGPYGWRGGRGRADLRTRRYGAVGRRSHFGTTFSA